MQSAKPNKAFKTRPVSRKTLLALSLGATLMITGQAHAFGILGKVKDAIIKVINPEPVDYTKTRYPIVLAHGLFGFANIAGIDYWFGIPGELRKSGAKVLISQTSAENSNEVIGEQLIEQLDDWAATYGVNKFNLIGHSQGGGAIRYVAGVRPDLVASLTTVGASHKGAGLADALTLIPEGPIQTSIAQVVNVIGVVINTISGGKANRPQDSLGALNSLSSKGAADFNRRFPLGIPTTACGEGAYQANGMRFYSWTGNTPVTTIADSSDSGMLAGDLVNVFFGKGRSDGMAPVCGAHFGQVISDKYRMNHLDEVNHVLGFTSPLEDDPKTLYRIHANRLKNAGL